MSNAKRFEIRDELRGVVKPKGGTKLKAVCRLRNFRRHLTDPAEYEHRTCLCMPGATCVNSRLLLCECRGIEQRPPATTGQSRQGERNRFGPRVKDNEKRFC